MVGDSKSRVQRKIAKDMLLIRVISSEVIEIARERLLRSNWDILVVHSEKPASRWTGRVLDTD